MLVLKVQDCRIMAIFLLLVPIKCEDTNEYISENIEEVNSGKQFGDWLIAPFEKWEGTNPILETAESEFLCPVTNKNEKWGSEGVLNPSAVVKDGKVYLFYTALSHDDAHYGLTSRIGLAASDDGLKFNREDNNSPIFYPASESEIKLEGGYQDPKVVMNYNETFVMIYTVGKGNNCALKVATSTNLKNWTSHGYAFKEHIKAKSASIVTAVIMGRFTAVIVNESYWMYFWNLEDNNIQMAHSADLINWEPVQCSNESKCLNLRNSEPGPQAILRIDGILLMYNSGDGKNNGDGGILGRSYTTARQALFAINDPTILVDQSTYPFLNANKLYEINAYNPKGKSIFLSALVCFKGKWLIYYGAGNNKISVAIKEDSYCKNEYEPSTVTESIIGDSTASVLNRSCALFHLFIYILTPFFNKF